MCLISKRRKLAGAERRFNNCQSDLPERKAASSICDPLVGSFFMKEKLSQIKAVCIGTDSSRLWLDSTVKYDDNPLIAPLTND